MQIVVKNLQKDFYVNESKEMGVKGILENLIKKNRKKVKAVKNLSFEIAEGEIVGFLGPNGAGKSTTIKMMTGILTPTRGEVKVCGVIPYQKRQQNAKNIGVVFGHRTQLWWDLPVKDSFLLLKKIYEIDDLTYKKNLSYFMELLDMESFIERPIRQLSLGQRMRCDLAAAFLHNPSIVYLDEPTIGLDITSKKKIREFVCEVNKERKSTIVLTTHDMSDIEQLATRVIVIANGDMIYDGTIEQLRRQYQNERVLTFSLKEDINKYLDLREWKHKVTVNYTNDKLVIRMPVNTPIKQMIDWVTSQYVVKDIKIDETSIEDIIEEVYKQCGNQYISM